MIKLGGVEVSVNQKPVSVSFVCPICDHENVYDYGDFCDMCGEPCDWEYKEIQCESCRSKFVVSGQDWQ